MLPNFNPQATTSGGLVASLIIKPGNRLFHIVFTNTNASARYVQLFDATALPADATVPTVLLGSVASGVTATFDFGFWGRLFANGIIICNSSTAATKTIGSADSFIDAMSS